MTQTTSEVIQTLNDALNSVETETSELAGGVRAVVAEQEAGRLFATLRRELDNDQWESRRDPSSENIVVNIEAEQQRGLGDLFS